MNAVEVIFGTLVLSGIAFTAGWGAGVNNNDTLALSRDLRTECEAQLPRDQICVMRYVPEVLE